MPYKAKVWQKGYPVNRVFKHKFNASVQNGAIPSALDMYDYHIITSRS